MQSLLLHQLYGIHGVKGRLYSGSFLIEVILDKVDRYNPRGRWFCEFLEFRLRARETTHSACEN